MQIHSWLVYACILEHLIFWFLPVCRAAFYATKAWNTCKTSTSSSSTTKPKCYTLQRLCSIYAGCTEIYAASVLALGCKPCNLLYQSHSHLIERNFLSPVICTESDLTYTLPPVIHRLGNSAQCSEGYSLCSPISDESGYMSLSRKDSSPLYTNNTRFREASI